MPGLDSTPISCPHALDAATAPAVIGTADSNIKVLEELFNVDVFIRGTTATITGKAPDVARCVKTLDELAAMAHRGHEISAAAVKHAAAMITSSTDYTPAPVAAEVSRDIIARRGKIIRAKTPGQRAYVDAIDHNTIIFGLGPAGSGKTYLAVAKAVQALHAKKVSRIILTRPAVEAGEKLGFLPGTLTEKIDPYLRPLYDALREMIDPEIIPQLMESGVIEVAPLAYMRGRTLSDAFVILDEAQNTTAAQMKMFLTRLGFGSTMVITGDVSQTDLPGGSTSGLKVVRRILEGVDSIHFADLGSDDVVRHHVVAAIVDAYDAWENTHQPGAHSRPSSTPTDRNRKGRDTK